LIEGHIMLTVDSGDNYPFQFVREP
jgi:hypothetical protein